MADSATTAFENDCELVRRIRDWGIEHPEAVEYCVNDEVEARELLAVIAASLKLILADVRDDDDASITLRDYARSMRKALAQGLAIEYIRELNQTQPLEFMGFTITTPDLVLQ